MAKTSPAILLTTVEVNMAYMKILVYYLVTLILLETSKLKDKHCI